MYSQDILDKVPLMWKIMFGNNKGVGNSLNIIPFFQEYADKNNMSLEDYIAYREAKELLNEGV